LVAPIVEEGDEYRDIYLPKGIWLDMNRKITHEGPKWLEDYHAPLDVLPFFKKS